MEKTVAPQVYASLLMTSTYNYLQAGIPPNGFLHPGINIFVSCPAFAFFFTGGTVQDQILLTRIVTVRCTQIGFILRCSHWAPNQFDMLWHLSTNAIQTSYVSTASSFPLLDPIAPVG